ncbi:kinesin-like protein KIF2A [Photinus pyralis]|uniref:kinesin-like protein KIF2A n=1 Tax=Photinus pyralis TaxID=7054 RepID=UPI0012674210|nr:kinesin-like protein KIF2A [Photinus pyralis]
MNNEKILQLGSSINIKRTDGRVHTACVSRIDYDLKSATVEWFENGETKGKEVDMDAIESLNPDIALRRPCDLQPSSSNSQVKMSPLQRNPTKASFATITNKTTSGTAISAAQFRHRQTALVHTNGHSQALAATANDTSRQSPNPSKCSVVKEIEKLKKNREERRQRQAEEKAEKDAFLQMAPGNPHWELLNMILDYRRGLDIRPLTENDAIEEHSITVCVRKRPLNKIELARKEVDVITIPSKNQLIVHEPRNKVDLTKYLENQLFRFDYAFDETCSNDIVYKYTAQPLIKTIFDGGFATCFAYGQTGSGKTHTMGGNFNGKNQDCRKGIYAMAAADVFQLAKSPKYRHLNMVVSSSFFEIYSGKVFDLLDNKTKLRILEDGKQQVQVVGLTEQVVTSVQDVLKLIQKGNSARTSGQTSANVNSSRSHAIFQILLRISNTIHKVYGKFSLIDLAGNERGADTSSADRQTRMEGAEINKSLLALKECIRALGRKGSHLPFRVSKLTQVLRDSFVGSNSKTCMIAMISPGVSSCEHSLNTLRYADRVKELGGGDLQTTSCEEEFDDEALVQLRSLNESDMTPEMLKFHQMISEINIAEDTMLDVHKQTLDNFLPVIIEQGSKYLKMAEEVEFDQEAYCAVWEELISNAMRELTRAREAITNLRSKMAAEEQLSRKTKRK